MPWVSCERNEATNRLELWNIGGSVIGEIGHDQPVVVFTDEVPLSVTMVQHDNHWKLQTPDMRTYDFLRPPSALIIQHPYSPNDQ